MSSIDDSIHFHKEFRFTLKDPSLLKAWLHQIAKKEGHSLESLNYVFLSDEALLEINQNYLGHDYYTDIITFPVHDEGSPLEADIYISVERVRDNARQFNSSFENEMLRVMSHGLLHLCGYGDKTAAEQERMKEKEEDSIALYEKVKRST